MSKKQLIVAWLLAILISYGCAFSLINIWVNAHLKPGLGSNNSFLFLVLLVFPPLIIGCLLIYSLRLRCREINRNVGSERKINIGQIVIVSGIILLGLMVTYLKLQLGFLSALIMIAFYLTIVSYPVYLIMVFIAWAFKKNKDRG